MKDSKLTEILSSFSKDEMKRFKKFVESPYYNGSENVRRFFREVEGFYPKFTNKNYTLRNIHSKLFPAKNYHDGVIRNLASDLYKLACDFLTAEYIKADKYESGLNTLKALRQKGLKEQFEKEYKNILADIDKNKKDDNYYLGLYSINEQSLEIFNIIKKTDRKHEEFLASSAANTERLIVFFLARILKEYCALIDVSTEFQIKPKLKFLETIKQYLNSNDYSSIPAISMFYDSLCLSTEPVSSEPNSEFDTIFTRLHNNLKENKHELPHNDIYTLYINLLNSSIAKIYEYDRKYFPLTFELIKEIIAGDYYAVEGGYMEYGFFSGAVNLGLNFKEYEWIEEFIHKYRDKLLPEQRENAYYHFLALLEFFKKNYEKSLELLSHSNPVDFYLLINNQRLQMMINYELGRIEEIYYLIDSYRHTLTRHTQIVERYKAASKTFLDCYTELVKVKTDFDEFRYKKLKDTLTDKTYPLIFKTWFIEKIEEMKQDKMKI